MCWIRTKLNGASVESRGAEVVLVGGSVPPSQLKRLTTVVAEPPPARSKEDVMNDVAAWALGVIDNHRRHNTGQLNGRSAMTLLPVTCCWLHRFVRDCADPADVFAATGSSLRAGWLSSVRSVGHVA